MAKDLRAFQEEIQHKIRNLVLEFGAGKISNEQFDIIYERYHAQLQMAASVIEGTEAPTNGMTTIAIKDATSGKALGMGIYHHNSGMMVETLGNFDLSPEIMSPILNNFSDKLVKNEFVEPVIRKLVSGIWVIFMARHFTTAVVIFRNEPAPRQIRELERLHHDFEEANKALLEKMTIKEGTLAKPFVGMVQKKMR